MFFNLVYTRRCTDVFSAENTFNHITRILEQLGDGTAIFMIDIRVSFKHRRVCKSAAHLSQSYLLVSLKCFGVSTNIS